MMVAPCKELVNIHDSKNPYYEPSNQYSTPPLCETDAQKRIEIPEEPHNTTNRPQSVCSLSSTASSINYATCMEAQNGMWAEQMDVVEEGLTASIQVTE